MKSSLRRTAALCFVFCLCLFGRIPAQSTPPGSTPPAAPTNALAEVIPPVPTRWFSDYANATSPSFADNLNGRLEYFEQATTNQFVVVIFPKMQSPAPVDDYCKRVFNAWGVGQKGVNNGVILFVFLENHKLWISVGRGLETPLTNPVCQGIAKGIGAAFHRGDYEGGITVGVDAIVKILQTQPRPQGTTR